MKMFQSYGREMFRELPYDEMVASAQFVDIGPVARWFFEDNERDQFDYARDFPTMVSPWPVTWMEYQIPPTVRIGPNVMQAARSNVGQSMGTLIGCFRLKDGRVALEEDAVYQLYRNAASMQTVENPYVDLNEQVKDRRRALDELIETERYPGWILKAVVFQEAPGHRVFPRGELYLYLDEDGQCIGPSLTTTLVALGKDADIGFSAFGFALSLLHCKNVHLEDVPVPPKVQQKREKRGIPSVVFKTLVVEPMRKQVKREAAADPDGEQNHIKRALHIARGHFKDYRAGPGLFGKYQGLYWWDMQVRGSAEAGAVIKDYQVRH